ncbi:MAG: hypothetical protein GY820_22605 [Gammaproteobacteria bacterium]|nr:hypothetical protein [Gammaproteobacteria bacterium]
MSIDEGLARLPGTWEQRAHPPTMNNAIVIQIIILNPNTYRPEKDRTSSHCSLFSYHQFTHQYIGVRSGGQAARPPSVRRTDMLLKQCKARLCARERPNCTYRANGGRATRPYPTHQC